MKECTNGLEALDWLKQNEADLIFVDFKMPVMDGIAFVEHLCHFNNKPPVIFISGHDDFQVARTAMRCGVIDYLLKPVEVEDMHICLKKWINSRIKKVESDERHIQSLCPP